MWCPVGYVTLFEIYGLFTWDFDQVEIASGRPSPTSGRTVIDVGYDSDEMHAFARWGVMQLFSRQPDDFRACLPSGIPVRLDQTVFGWHRKGGLIPPLVSMGPFPKDYAMRRDILDFELFDIDLPDGCIKPDIASRSPVMGALAAAPICIREADLPAPMDKLTSFLIQTVVAHADEYMSDGQPRRRLPQIIVDAFKSGEVSNKAEARGKFGRNMKHVEWQAHWEEAAAILPALSWPGRRREKSTR